MNTILNVPTATILLNTANYDIVASFFEHLDNLMPEYARFSNVEVFESEYMCGIDIASYVVVNKENCKCELVYVHYDYKTIFEKWFKSCEDIYDKYMFSNIKLV